MSHIMNHMPAKVQKIRKLQDGLDHELYLDVYQFNEKDERFN